MACMVSLTPLRHSPGVLMPLAVFSACAANFFPKSVPLTWERSVVGAAGDDEEERPDLGDPPRKLSTPLPGLVDPPKFGIVGVIPPVPGELKTSWKSNCMVAIIWAINACIWKKPAPPAGASRWFAW